MPKVHFWKHQVCFVNLESTLFSHKKVLFLINLLRSVFWKYVYRFEIWGPALILLYFYSVLNKVYFYVIYSLNFYFYLPIINSKPIFIKIIQTYLKNSRLGIMLWSFSLLQSFTFWPLVVLIKLCHVSSQNSFPSWKICHSLISTTYCF